MTDYLHALPSGYRIEEYELVRVLGSGGFGITYLGYDHHLDKAVAIKEYLPNDLAVRTDNNSVLPKSTEDTPDYEWGLERFLSEAQTLARFDHRHIIKIHRFFRAHGTGYSVMEYAEGETLSEVLQRKGTLTEAELKAILFPILDGLEAVHEADFLHRDIKPGNIVIRDDGSPVLIDFGSARQAVAGKSRSVTAIVTPGYAPIEQYSAKGHQGPWTDIYGLGAVCYRCLAGEPPDDATERLREDPLVPATQRCKGKVSASLLDAIDRSLRVDEGERPQSIAAWREVLADGGNSDQRTTKSAHKVVTRPAEGSTTARAGMSWLSRALVAVIVALLGASAWQGWQLYRGASGKDKTVVVVEQKAGTQNGTEADVALDTQDVEVLPAMAGTGTGQSAEEPEASPPPEEKDEVSRLLAAAEADLAARRLTSPVGNNAWEKYQRVLKLAPAHAEAIAGMERVIGSYLELYESALEQGAFDKAATYRSRIRDLLAGEMVSIPGGRSRMGDLSVTVKPFRLGKHEVTVGQFRRFVETTGYRTDAERNAGGVAGCANDRDWTPGRSWRSPGYAVDNNQPVVCVSWNDAQAYTEWLTAQTGESYRLPSEAEWEYAARAGSTMEYHFGMHGKVWEWVQDCYNYSYEGAPSDGSAWESGECSWRMMRRSSSGRVFNSREQRFHIAGFRLAQDE